MQKLKTWYLAQSQDVRFGIPVIAGMIIFLPIVWAITSQPPTCKEAQAAQERVLGDSKDFGERSKAIADVMKACYGGKK